MSLGAHREWRNYDQLADELGIKASTLRKTVSRDAQSKTPTFETKTEHRKGWVRTVTRGVSQDVTEDVTDDSEDEE